METRDEEYPSNRGKSKKKSAKDRFIPIPAKLIWKIKDRMRQREAQQHDLVFPNGQNHSCQLILTDTLTIGTVYKTTREHYQLTNCGNEANRHRAGYRCPTAASAFAV